MGKKDKKVIEDSIGIGKRVKELSVLKEGKVSLVI